MQKAFSFDQVTLDKVKTSAFITIGGVLLIVIPLLSSELTDYIISHDPIDWRTPLIVTIGAVSTWCVATIRQFIKGK